ncbi:hypothetical protein HHI36_012793 [Cryptolaemus montrouzieri]|uniref:Uncharacterized protein n=1 Tax=Cryptolaemus montrouzieri TaxID=559131 RepID=A0ABD2NGB8_9CUCU
MTKGTTTAVHTNKTKIATFQGNSTAQTFAGVAKRPWIHVSRVQLDTEPQIIKSYLKKKFSENSFTVELLPKREDARSVSFKVSTKLDIVNDINNLKCGPQEYPSNGTVFSWILTHPIKTELQALRVFGYTVADFYSRKGRGGGVLIPIRKDKNFVGLNLKFINLTDQLIEMAAVKISYHKCICIYIFCLYHTPGTTTNVMSS